MSKSYRTALGFDYGKTKLGIAAGNDLINSTTPLTTLRLVGSTPDWEAISRLVQQWSPTDLVVGLPVNMDGSEHPLAVPVHRFYQQLQKRYNLPVHLVDERLTSVEAERILAKRSGKKRIDFASRSAKETIDQIAAELILQTWFGL